MISVWKIPGGKSTGSAFSSEASRKMLCCQLLLDLSPSDWLTLGAEQSARADWQPCQGSSAAGAAHESGEHRERRIRGCRRRESGCAGLGHGALEESVEQSCKGLDVCAWASRAWEVYGKMECHLTCPRRQSGKEETGEMYFNSILYITQQHLPNIMFQDESVRPGDAAQWPHVRLAFHPHH